MGIQPAEQVEHWHRTMRLARVQAEDLRQPSSHEHVRDGLALRYLTWSGGDTAPIVLLHGGGLTCRTWDLVCLNLRTDFRCVTPDLRGHGDSDWSPVGDYSLAAHAEDVRALVGQLGTDPPLLVGHSLGGLTALTYAAAGHPLAGLVLVDTGPDLSEAGVADMRGRVAAAPASGTLDHFIEHALRINPRRNPRALRVSLRHNLRPAGDGQWTWKHDPARQQPDRRARLRTERERLGSRLGAVARPVLVLRGAQSKVLTPRAADELAASFPDGRLREIPSSGHTVQGDNPAAVLEAIRMFAAEVGFPRLRP